MKKTIAIIGAGPCALMLGNTLDPKIFDIQIYEKNSSAARKFLVAGDGGLNLTHSENPLQFLSRYTPASFLKKAFNHFTNHDLINWLTANGLETFVGSSGRVFPKKGIKPIEVLNLLVQKAKNNKAQFYFEQEWKGFDEENNLLFEHKGQQKTIKADLVIFCLGGASWPVTGSTGAWLNYFKTKNIATKTFLASNCAFQIKWDTSFIKKAEGKVLKNCKITCGTKSHLGEVVITKFGMEGSGIYPLSPEIREQLKTNGSAHIQLDLKPNLSAEKILEKLNAPKSGTNFTQHLKTQLNLSEVQVFLLKQYVSKEDFLDLPKLIAHIKCLQLSITALAPIEDAISSVGGISLEEVDENFELKKMPHHFVIGEMLDYDAPTGGYLLQACFSMAKYVGDLLNKR